MFKDVFKRGEGVAGVQTPEIFRFHMKSEGKEVAYTLREKEKRMWGGGGAGGTTRWM